jgi:hypothetical protein
MKSIAVKKCKHFSIEAKVSVMELVGNELAVIYWHGTKQAFCVNVMR